MNIQVISLERTPQRLEDFYRKNPNMVNLAQHFVACDGKLLPPDELVKQGIAEEGVDYGPGMMGSCMSHVTLWRRAAETGETITVCEDDAVLSERFVEHSTQLMSTQKDFDIIIWGWNFDSIMFMDMLPGICPAVITTNQKLLCGNWEKFATQEHDRRLFKLYGMFGIMCYTISPQGAKNLLSQFPMQPDQVPWVPRIGYVKNGSLDSFLNLVYKKVGAYVSFPPLAISENDPNTSTQATPPTPPTATAG